jgi:hypothetical protein
VPQDRGTAAACPEGTVPANSRRDDDGNVHERAIDCVIFYEIASGTSATEYSPGRDVDRAQMARFVANLIESSGGELPADPPDAFSDDDGSFHEEKIDQLAAAGIVEGTSAGRYSPDAPVNRGQMAKFLVLAYEFVSDRALTEAGDYFADDESSSQESNINKAAEAGFAVGREGRYEEGGNVRRDAMASFLARVVDLLVAEGTTPVRS